MILSTERKLTIDITKEVDRIALDGFIKQAKEEGFEYPIVSCATLGPSSVITVVVTKKEESQ